VRTRLLYTALTLLGGSIVVAGVGLIFPPGAVILAGLAVAAFGFIGLGIEVRP